MTTTDEHYDERDMDDLKTATEVWSKKRSGRVLPRIERVMKKMACNSAAYSAALNCGGRRWTSDLWVMRTTAYLLALSLQSFGSFLFIRVSYCLGVSVVGRVVEGSQKLPNQMEPFSFFRVRSFAGWNSARLGRPIIVWSAALLPSSISPWVQRLRQTLSLLLLCAKYYENLRQ